MAPTFGYVAYVPALKNVSSTLAWGLISLTLWSTLFYLRLNHKLKANCASFQKIQISLFQS